MPAISVSLSSNSSLWDRIGITVSGLCVVHCLAVPVVLSLLPLWPMAEAVDAWLHPILALFLIPTTVLAGAKGFRYHRHLRIVTLLAAGLVVVLGASVLGLFGVDPNVEAGFTLLGGGLLIGGHWRNWRADRCCDEAVACTTHTDHDHAE